MITYNLLNKYNKIAHFCTTRQGGTSVGNYASFNLSPFSGDDMSAVFENQSKLAEWLGIDADKIILPFQTHGTEVKEITDRFFELADEEKRDYLSSVDAIFTRIQKVCIGISTADCVPILFYDPTKQVVAAAHAGWRGTCGRIAEKTIKALVEVYHCEPSDILVIIGPSISAKVYEVGQEVVDNFESAGFEIPEIVEIRNKSIYLDLWKANEQSLLKAGITADNIEVAGICTFTEHERFFSARRLGIKSGRLLSGIMLKSELM
jgi:polyphenol oxidase